MKKTQMNRIVEGILGGIVISYFITIGISFKIVDGYYYPCVPTLVERFGNEMIAVSIQTLLSAILGAGFAGSSFIWEKDDWNLFKQTSLYFVIVSSLMMIVAYICEWMEHSLKGFLCYFTIFLVIFIVVWIVQYMIWKRRISEINAKIADNI